MSAKQMEGDKQQADLTPLISRVEKSFPLFTIPLEDPLGFSLSLPFSFQTGVGISISMQTTQFCPGSQAKDMQHQCRFVRLQARGIPHCHFSILTPILKIKLIGVNFDAGLIPLECITNIFIFAYCCIRLVRERLKAVTCIQKINWQISLLQAAPSHCHSADHKVPIIYCIITLREKSCCFFTSFSNSESFILKQVISKICLFLCLCIHPAWL